MITRSLAVVVAAVVCGAPAFAQDTGTTPITADFPVRSVHFGVDSGFVENTGDTLDVIFSAEVRDPKASWLRLEFGEVVLSGQPDTASESLLVITSLEDGAVQYLNARHVVEWGHTSAYFNGDAVRVEILSAPGTGPNRVEVLAGSAGEQVEIGDRSICGAVDDRVPSTYARDARYLPIYCSSWLIGERCFLTAGHCVTSTGVMQFNVPLSNSNGSPRHPGPEDQYTMDPTSMQSTNGGVGNDWAYYGCFDNSNTGLSPYEAQGDKYELASVAPPVSGQTIRITGYGSTDSSVPGSWNSAQKTHTGNYVLRSGNTIRYATDTTGGNSGSAVFNETDGVAIGIHTHAGCNSVGGNQGTAINNPGLQAALANPLGICRFADCNNNGENDYDEIDNGLETDCNDNNLLDSCEITDGSVDDCNGNGLPDPCDIAAGTSADCNFNGVPDECELAEGTADDCNNNGVLDECDILPVFYSVGSPNLAPFGFGANQSHTFTSTPPADGDVTLQLQAKGDLDETTERVTVLMGGSLMGFAFESASSCPSTPDADTIIVPQTTWNAAIVNDEVTVEMLASSAVDPDVCLGGSYINIRATYSIGSIADENGNGVPDECESPACSQADVTTQGAGPGDGNYGVPDGAVTAADINYFVGFWLAGDLAVADVNTQGAPLGDPAYGQPDGIVTGADLNFYVGLWLAGCP